VGKTSDAAHYDEVAYPSATFLQTHPNRLAILARLHGLAAPDVETARVLEIGGGDGLNLIAMAVAWPRATFLNIDLAAAPVARGAALIEQMGLSNVRCAVEDIRDLTKSHAAGSFDYIIAHGVYAWVPAPVRHAILAAFAHLLSPEGIAFVSFNAMPGGQIRQIMRDMTRHAIDGVIGNDARLAAAVAFLEDYKASRSDDGDLVAALRNQAAAMLSRPRAGLFHDELGPFFSPQSLTQIVKDAEPHYLEFLTDSGSNRTRDGFAAETTNACVRRLQTDDYGDLRFFRQIIFVSEGRYPSRTVDGASLGDLFIGGAFEERETGEWQTPSGEFTLHDETMAAIFRRLDKHWPRYLPLADLGVSDAQIAALVELWHDNLVFLSTTPERFALDPGTHPCASPLVRVQLEQGTPNVCSLHHVPVGVEDPAARTLLAACDGTLDRAALSAIWAETPHNPAVTLAIALDVLARQRLMMPPG
jgi:predicted O-methyltransferase YrrM